MNRNPVRNPRTLVGLIAVCLTATLCLHPTVFAADPAPSARTIMENVYSQDTSHDISMRATFQLFDAQGHSTKKEFTYRRLGSPGDSKTLVVFTAPKEIRGIALLSINQRGANQQQSMYVPAQDRVRSVAAQERTARFIGTDFTFEDIGERVLDDFSYKL